MLFNEKGEVLGGLCHENVEGLLFISKEDESEKLQSLMDVPERHTIMSGEDSPQVEHWITWTDLPFRLEIETRHIIQQGGILFECEYLLTYNKQSVKVVGGFYIDIDESEKMVHIKPGAKVSVEVKTFPNTPILFR